MIAIYSSDDLIYNRFDLIYRNVESLCFELEGIKYKIDVQCSGMAASLNVWGKMFPQVIFDKCVNKVFLMHPEILYINVTRCGNNYNEWLYKSNSIYLSLPLTSELLLSRLNGKHRYTLRKKIRRLEKDIGIIETRVISRNQITDEMVNQYFKWKKDTHGTEYGLSSEEYLDTYYVTNAMLLCVNNSMVGIVFYCKVNRTVYLENFSYEYDLRRYSIGSIQYFLWLQCLVKDGCKHVFLGGGRYKYKEHFDSKDCVVYSGKIYSPKCIRMMNQWLTSNHIRQVAFYGVGAVGKAFLAFSKNLNMNVIYGIDRRRIDDEKIKIYPTQDDLPNVDAVFITIVEKDEEVYKALKNRFSKVYYWNDIENML